MRKILRIISAIGNITRYYIHAAWDYKKVDIKLSFKLNFSNLCLLANQIVKFIPLILASITAINNRRTDCSSRSTILNTFFPYAFIGAFIENKKLFLKPPDIHHG
jgi:hypothetical protein